MVCKASFSIKSLTVWLFVWPSFTSAGELRREQAGARESGERTRLACWFRRHDETGFPSASLCSIARSYNKSSQSRGRARQHARSVFSPEMTAKVNRNVWVFNPEKKQDTLV